MKSFSFRISSLILWSQKVLLVSFIILFYAGVIRCLRWGHKIFILCWGHTFLFYAGAIRLFMLCWGHQIFFYAGVIRFLFYAGVIRLLFYAGVIRFLFYAGVVRFFILC